jgi:ribosomal-protein-alanine N-acetyltransferase
MTPDVHLSLLRPEDTPRCAELERILFPGDDPWTERMFRDELRLGYHYVGAYASAGELIAYAGIGIVGGPPDAEADIHTIGVHPAWQRKGIARELMRELLDHADKSQATVFLEVRTDNHAAITLYEAHGFITQGIRRKYYQPSGADAYTMKRPSTLEQPA